ncbi:MAG: hypothetical protein RLZZ385_814 [Pseudomonadota bacterium]|jgi:DNA repair photolyase
MDPARRQAAAKEGCAGRVAPERSRGAHSNPHNRFAQHQVLDFDDGWWREPEDATRKSPTVVAVDHSKTIISTNRSPDVPFHQSLNPYRGCEHGCIYCFARPSHEYLDLSLGRDFETRLFYKPDAVDQLEAFLQRPAYRCEPIALGINTDAYQPLEKNLQLTRQLLQVMLRYRHPVSLVTKGSLILRDLDILQELAQLGLVSVMVSVTTLDDELKRIMEPRAAAPATRLKVIRRLRDAGVPVGVLLAPVIPFINDHELETILRACGEHGAQQAGYVLLRLPHQLKTLFGDWLDAHYLQRKERVLNTMKDLHGGQLYRSGFGTRMQGQGIYAQLIRRRFQLARDKYGLRDDSRQALRSDLFRVPGTAEQFSLGFG